MNHGLPKSAFGYRVHLARSAILSTASSTGGLCLSGTYGTAFRQDGEEDFLPIIGKLGRELSIEEGYKSARLMVINHLAMAKAVLETLDRIERVIRLLGFVNSAPGLKDAPKVLNGASDLLIEIFGAEPGSTRVRRFISTS